MKRFSMLLAAGLFALCLAACGTSPTVTGSTTVAATPASTVAATATAIASFRIKVETQCGVVGPLLNSMMIMNAANTAAVADLSTASNLFGKVCVLAAAVPTAQTSFTVADLSNAVNEGVPALLKAVAASNLTAAKKTDAQLLITGAQLAFAEAIQNYAPGTVIVPVGVSLGA